MCCHFTDHSLQRETAILNIVVNFFMIFENQSLISCMHFPLIVRLDWNKLFHISITNICFLGVFPELISFLCPHEMVYFAQVWNVLAELGDTAEKPLFSIMLINPDDRLNTV